ncbi:type III pantothenate kinase [Echinicola pacifica]|uniref:Type III pantothenate kinase n=1 Tax=Echinicola pacifica TaxID=346377 RepID=A0A918UML4_9BACT|nr:type III pantothenate kinase [Echinicola pacifica]GGZ20909.1 type III pantothenate kinase [Echinicola pacifica]
MFLSIDAGNSNIVIGIKKEDSSVWEPIYRIPTQQNLSAAALEKSLRLFLLENGIKTLNINNIGLSSVVPELNASLINMCRMLFQLEPYLIDEYSYGNLSVKTSRPAEMGTDLMANACAAYQHYQQACIIVDFGTALTFTIVDEQGNIAGVNIVPGLKTALNSLFATTSKLPQVKLELPSSVIGKDTVHSIQAGILYGYTGLVKGMLSSIRSELPLDFKVIATGGLSKILTTLKSDFDMVDQNLTLEGVRLITLHQR